MSTLAALSRVGMVMSRTEDGWLVDETTLRNSARIDVRADGKAYMTRAQLIEFRSQLGGYDRSMPTGVYPGKRWVREELVFDGKAVSYVVGEYAASPTDPTRCKINWYPVVITDEVKNVSFKSGIETKKEDFEVWR